MEHSESIWRAMLQRCYSLKFQEHRPTYIGVEVCKDWWNFKNFEKWYNENYIENFVLDKDILFKGNKIYSAKTCCFVPQEINQIFVKSNNKRGKYPIGVCLNGKNYLARYKKYGKQINLGTYKTPEKAFEVYKHYKEKQIKNLAEINKNKIPDKVYLALINYKVEITD